MENKVSDKEVLLNDEDEQTSYDKGRELEDEFSIFMKRELKWDKVRVGAHLPQKMNKKGAAIDIISERLDERGKNFHKAAMWWVIGALACILMSLIMIATELGTGEIFLAAGIAVGVGGFFFMYQSNKHNKENGWVECKNLKGKSTLPQIDKSLREYREYKNSGDKEYKFEYHYFVSKSGYVENALRYAIEHNIICYEKSGDTFKKVGYWD